MLGKTTGGNRNPGESAGQEYIFAIEQNDECRIMVFPGNANVFGTYFRNREKANWKMEGRAFFANPAGYRLLTSSIDHLLTQAAAPVLRFHAP